jgi:hypothetical protein
VSLCSERAALPSVWLASLRCFMLHTMGNRIAQQQMMSTCSSMARQRLHVIAQMAAVASLL